MKRTTAGALAGIASLALAATLMPGAASAGPASGRSFGGSGNLAIGLTGSGKLVAFHLRLPEVPRTIGKISGLTGDTALVGVDYRVQDRKLYGVGNAGGVYTISTWSAKATKVSQLTVPLLGAKFGVDFNPAADRLRVVSDTGQNLRHDVNPGGATVIDSHLTYPPAITPAAGISAAAYTNNDLDPTTATTLFDLDTTLDQVALQSPANSGQLAATGKLGVDAGPDAGFDIFSDTRHGTTQSVRGWATLGVNGKYALYSVSLLTGKAHIEGRFPRHAQVTDLAVKLDH
ncbi:DUF4394 domain-containing protein [Nocardioides speluncae]|uniref:DUF4394 domain-containing protein n=1 Tax=Nocardioides speluncae TaxID=2670337 RepID=UPI000D687AA3|nr:DUF4394 domain-containing protein [Nocardioides speluncae]